jgi:acyl-CoA thioesterase-1
VAKAKRVALVPFLLEGFADKRELFQPDNLHPTAEAQPLMLETIWKTLAPVIKVK